MYEDGVSSLATLNGIGQSERSDAAKYAAESCQRGPNSKEETYWKNKHFCFTTLAGIPIEIYKYFNGN